MRSEKADGGNQGQRRQRADKIRGGDGQSATCCGRKDAHQRLHQQRRHQRPEARGAVERGFLRLAHKVLDEQRNHSGDMVCEIVVRPRSRREGDIVRTSAVFGFMVVSFGDCQSTRSPPFIAGDATAGAVDWK